MRLCQLLVPSLRTRWRPESPAPSAYCWFQSLSLIVSAQTILTFLFPTRTQALTWQSQELCGGRCWMFGWRWKRIARAWITGI